VSTDLELVQRRNWRQAIPKEHRQSLDTRINWLYNQRFGTVQTIWSESSDMLDRTAASLIMQAILEKDLDSIEQIYKRLEGGAIADTDVLKRQESQTIRV